MKPRKTLYDYVRERRGYRCDVRGCGQKVYDLSRYCSAHWNRSLRYGSPTGRRLELKELAPHLERTDAFLKANEGHPALVQAFGDLDSLLKAGSTFTTPARLRPRDYASRLRVQLQRLVRGGVTGGDVFRTVAAVYLVSQSCPDRLEPGSRALRFAMARTVLKLRPLDGRLSTLALNDLGNTLWSLLLPVLVAMAYAVQQATSPTPLHSNQGQHQ